MKQDRITYRPAFSLLELLLVVTIIGIIAAIVVPRVTSSTDNAKVRVREANIAQMNSAIERYQIEEDGLPTALTDLEPNYLPEGVPVDPDGGSYSLNSTTHRVEYTP